MKLSNLLLADNVFIEYLNLNIRTITAVHIFPMYFLYKWLMPHSSNPYFCDYKIARLHKNN